MGGGPAGNGCILHSMMLFFLAFFESQDLTMCHPRRALSVELRRQLNASKFQSPTRPTRGHIISPRTRETRVGRKRLHSLQKKRTNAIARKQKNRGTSRKRRRKKRIMKTRHSLGVANGPFNATVFFLMLLMASSGMAVFPFFKMGVTSTSSH